MPYCFYFALSTTSYAIARSLNMQPRISDTIRKSCSNFSFNCNICIFKTNTCHLVINTLLNRICHSPQVFDLIKQLDGLAAAARPVTSVALFLVGGGPLGHAAAPVAHSLAFDAVLHIAGGTGAVLAGETALTGTTAGFTSRWSTPRPWRDRRVGCHSAA